MRCQGLYYPELLSCHIPLGYIGKESIAWCSIAPRSTNRRLINNGSSDKEIWPIACFFVIRLTVDSHGQARGTKTYALSANDKRIHPCLKAWSLLSPLLEALPTRMTCVQKTVHALSGMKLAFNSA